MSYNFSEPFTVVDWSVSNRWLDMRAAAQRCREFQKLFKRS